MAPANGHADTHALPGPASVPVVTPTGVQHTPTEVRDFMAKLEVPFHPSVVEWRVINTAKGGKPRGQVIPYADQRAYTDRLNELFTPAGWTRRYVVSTSANFQRGKDQKTVAKIVVTCNLEIFGFGSHSATGEEWADDDNAATSAEAQSYKRACSCFGLGRYLYYFDGVWVDLDAHKRPQKLPKLPRWATPDGWQQGLRPPQRTNQHAPLEEAQSKPAAPNALPRVGNVVALIAQIEAMQECLGTALYRGLLRTVCKAWKPADISDPAMMQKVLAHMQGAKRGLLRLDSAANTLGPEALKRVLRELQLESLAKVKDLTTLKRIVQALEAAAATTKGAAKT